MIKVYGDLKGIEASENHIHIENIIPEFRSRPKDAFRFALLLLDTWESKLKNNYPDKSFNIILSFDGKYPVIRFNTYRSQEGHWINPSELEGFKEAILVKEF
jgi:hypothetical protein